MKRRDSLMIVYLGAWLASMELAAELLLAEWQWSDSLLAARAAQFVGLALVAWGVWNLRRPLNETITMRTDEVARALSTERIMNAYTSEILTHLYMAGMVLSVALVYALVLYARLLAALPAHTYYLIVIAFTFAALVTAWLLPVREMLREERRLREAADTPLPLG